MVPDSAERTTFAWDGTPIADNDDAAVTISSGAEDSDSDSQAEEAEDTMAEDTEERIIQSIEADPQPANDSQHFDTIMTDEAAAQPPPEARSFTPLPIRADFIDLTSSRSRSPVIEVIAQDATIHVKKEPDGDAAYQPKIKSEFEKDVAPWTSTFGKERPIDLTGDDDYRPWKVGILPNPHGFGTQQRLVSAWDVDVGKEIELPLETIRRRTGQAKATQTAANADLNPQSASMLDPSSTQNEVGLLNIAPQAHFEPDEVALPDGVPRRQSETDAVSHENETNPMGLEEPLFEPLSPDEAVSTLSQPSPRLPQLDTVIADVAQAQTQAIAVDQGLGNGFDDLDEILQGVPPPQHVQKTAEKKTAEKLLEIQKKLRERMTGHTKRAGPPKAGSDAQKSNHEPAPAESEPEIDAESEAETTAEAEAEAETDTNDPNEGVEPGEEDTKAKDNPIFRSDHEAHETIEKRYKKLQKIRKRTEAQEIEFIAAQSEYERSKQRLIIKKVDKRRESTEQGAIVLDDVAPDDDDAAAFDKWDNASKKLRAKSDKAREFRRGTAAKRLREKTERSFIDQMAERAIAKRLKTQKRSSKKSKKGEAEDLNDGKKSKKRKRGVKKQSSKIHLTKKEEKAQKRFAVVIAGVNGLRHADMDQDVGGDAPRFREGDKQRSKAIKQMIADIPAHLRGEARNEMKEIEDAARSFPRNTVRVDAKGGFWKHEVSFLFRRAITFLYNQDMGMGKTLQSIAVMINSRADVHRPQATLIVAPASVVDEWLSEIVKHVHEEDRSHVQVYRAGNRPHGLDVEEAMESCFCVITTYTELIRSASEAECPEELVTAEQIREYYGENTKAKAGPLHRIHWHRVILDEGHLIKNFQTLTARACFLLEADHRWILTGSPLVNSLLEAYSYLLFLRHPIAGSRDQYIANFTGSEKKMQKLQATLSSIMLRRNYQERFMAKKIIDLPDHTRQTTEIEFSRIERAYYNIFRKRICTNININVKKKHRAGAIQHVLKALTHCRQLTCHFLLGAETFRNLLTETDKAQMRAIMTESQKGADEYHAVTSLRRILAQSFAAHAGVNVSPGILGGGMGGRFGATDDTAAEVMDQVDALADIDVDRDVCKLCSGLLADPVVKVNCCGALFDEECLEHQLEAAALDEQERISCINCNMDFEESEFEKIAWTSKSDRKKDKERHRENQDRSWITNSDSLLASSKLLAVKAQIQNWWQERDNGGNLSEAKIIVYTQWIPIIKCLKRICDDEDWAYNEFHGGLKIEDREKEKRGFIDTPGRRILLASLKAGGVGLNLTCASRILNIDCWWNYVLEAQAYHRIYRLGQQAETKVNRIIVKDTIDENLIKMQERKTKEIQKALNEGGEKTKTPSLEELLALFGHVVLDEDGDPQIIHIHPDHESYGGADREGPYMGGDRGVPLADNAELTT